MDINNPMMNDDLSNDQNNSEFDSGFDAGVEADPVEDPKKYIQQLTGKLSQELRNYNKEQSDEELNKYVAGMIIPQATQGLTDQGKKEIIGKIKKGNVDDTSIENTTDEEISECCENNVQVKDKNYFQNIVSEIFQDMISNHEINDREEKKITNKKMPSKNPFISNR